MRSWWGVGRKAARGCPGRSVAACRRRAREAPPTLTTQFAIIRLLYDDMLSHHGRAIGRRHARKHLGWALNAAAETAGHPRACSRHIASGC